MSILKNYYKKIKYLILDGFFHILIGNVLIKIIAFVSSILVVRIITKEQYGYLSYADNLYSYITLLSGLGLSTAILKFCSPSKEIGVNKYFLRISIKYGSLFQIILSVLLVIGVSFLDIPFPEARSTIYILILFPLGTQLVTTLQSYARSLLNNKLYARMGVIQTLVLFVCSISLTYIMGVVGVVLARYIAMIVVIIMGIAYVRETIPKQTQVIQVNNEERIKFWKISISLMMANLFSMIMPINESYLISSMIRDELVTANYKVATLIPSQIQFITSSVIIYAFPKISQKAEKKEGALKYTLKLNMVLVAMISIITLVGIAITGILVRTIYGNNYLDAITLSRIYWIAYGVNAGFRMLPMSMLPAFGITISNTIISAIFCCLHALLLFLLIPIWGIYGAAITSIIVYIISSIVYWAYLLIKCK